jgi:hypothetical protein
MRQLVTSGLLVEAESGTMTARLLMSMPQKVILDHRILENMEDNIWHS